MHHLCSLINFLNFPPNSFRVFFLKNKKNFFHFRYFSAFHFSFLFFFSSLLFPKKTATITMKTTATTATIAIATTIKKTCVCSFLEEGFNEKCKDPRKNWKQNQKQNYNPPLFSCTYQI